MACSAVFVSVFFYGAPEGIPRTLPALLLNPETERKGQVPPVNATPPQAEVEAEERGG